MSTKLYVSNLSQAATAAGLRELFAACGEVLEVAFAKERNPRAVPSAAYITMATPGGAVKAVGRLHGRLHHDRSLMVTTEAPPERVDGKPAPARVVPGVTIAQQYRDRLGLSYELDCAGTRLTLRFLFPIEGESGWRLEAQFGTGAKYVADATAATRRQALDALSNSWAHATAEAPAPDVDWAAVAVALKAVKAME